MEETVEAAATVIKYIGDEILKSKCRELVENARGVGHTAGRARVSWEDLNRAAQQLEDVDAGQERLSAVVKLRDESACLESAARASLDAVRGAAAHLARLCQEYHKTAEGMGKILQAKSEPADDRAARSWWSLLFRRNRRRPADEEGGIPPKEAAGGVDLKLTVKLLSQGKPQLDERGHKLLVLAREVIAAAERAHMPRDEMLRATGALEQAGDPAELLRCVLGLGTAATAAEAQDSEPLSALCDRAADLARACRELKEAADAMGRVQRAAEKQRERRAAGAWWLWFRRRGEQREVLQDSAAAAALQPDLGQGENNRSTMAGFALSGSLTLITYLGPEKVAQRVDILPEWLRYCVHIGLSIWWSLQSAGVPCSAYARSLLELRGAQIMCRLGMLGLNGFVIVFVYLALGIHCKVLLCFLLLLPVVLHTCSFCLALRRGDLSR